MNAIEQEISNRNIVTIFKMMQQQSEVEKVRGEEPRSSSPYLEYTMDKLQIPRPAEVSVDICSSSSSDKRIIEID